MLGQRACFRFPGAQSLRNIARLRDLKRQCHRVQKRHIGGLAKIGRHGMRGIADDCHAAVRPVTAFDIDNPVPATSLSKAGDQVGSTGEFLRPEFPIDR